MATGISLNVGTWAEVDSNLCKMECLRLPAMELRRWTHMLRLQVCWKLPTLE